jgi:putative endonuclease
MKIDTQWIGASGELLAANFLTTQGLRIIERQYQTRWGEVDLICQDQDTWIFVEVKWRAQLASPTAADAVTRAKQGRIVGAALSYLKKRGIDEAAMRFDVVLIEGGTVEWLQDAFELDTAYTY